MHCGSLPNGYSCIELDMKQGTEQEAEPRLPWPISGMSYVVAFMGPIPAGLCGGDLAGNWLGLLIGLAVGVGITFLNLWFTGRFIEPLILRFQKPLLRRVPRVMVNVAAFAWAVALCAFAMFIPILILEDAALGKNSK